ncbi:MAG: InlB B-repeat-containing protein [Methanosphaera sp.]|nr:InlB B-repeat-containing protein [Methanosphaera sp.]
MKKNKVFLLLFLFLSIIIYTVAYSGLSTELGITSAVKFRPIVDIRVEDIRLKSAEGGAMIQYEPNTWQPDWNVADTITGFKLPNAESTLTYTVKVKNYGDEKQCIYSTSINDSTVNYEIDGYVLKQVIAPGEEVTFDLTFTPTTPFNENKDIRVHYEFRKVYDIEFNANGGTGAPGSVLKYERENLVRPGTFPSTIPTKAGHSFVGWTINSDGTGVVYPYNDGNDNYIYDLDGDRILYAKWIISNVYIQLDMNGGTLSGNKGENVSNDGTLVTISGSKTIHSLTYGQSLTSDGLMDYNDPLNINIERIGYHAVSGHEWVKNADSTGTSYDQTAVYSSTDFTNSTVDTTVTLYVNWTPDEYTLTYNLNGGTLPTGVTNPNTYTIETPNFTLNNPTKEGSVFLGWREGDSGEPTTTKTISTGSTGNKVLNAIFEDVQAPTITHVPTNWTNSDVTVSITSDHNNYTYMYAIDDGDYIPYNGPFPVSKNCTVTAYSVKSGAKSLDTDHEIANIDTTNPSLSVLSSSDVTESGFTIGGSAQDDESGLSELRIYLDDVYQTSISYTTDLNEEKEFSYTFSNLESSTDYVVKIEAIDVAGNHSIVRELTVTTDGQVIPPVARLIGYGNTDYDCESNPSLCTTYTTLKSALERNSGGINCLTTKCKIQMLDNVIESNSILGGQDIVLDLNGFTINGNRNYTFTVNNNATFTVYDSESFDPEEDEFDEATHNCIKNETNTVIINNGTFNLGLDNTEEDVSIYTPYIKAANIGINTTNGTFNFYDGRILASNAISGDVEDTPDTYKANIEIRQESEITYQVGTLRVLSDVEARIGSKYYTKVALAVDAAKESYYEDILSNETIMESMDKTGQYGFIKSGNFLVNENNTTGTMASAQIVMDLREYEEDQVLTVSTNRVKNSSNTNDSNSGYVMVFSGNSTSGSVLENNSVPLGEKTFNMNLPKGSMYTLLIYYNIGSSETYPEDAKMYITGITLRDKEVSSPSPYEDMNVTTIGKNYGFDYDATTGTFTSNNQYVNGTKAFGYYEVDLTNSGDKRLIVNATLSTYGSSNYGNIIVTTDNTVRTSTDSSAFAYMYGYNSSSFNLVGPQTFNKTLSGGQKYYVQFYYFKNGSDNVPISDYQTNNCKDQFIINSIEVIDEPNLSSDSVLSLDIRNTLVGDTVPFYKSYDNGVNSEFRSTSNTSEISHSYLPIDLTHNASNKYLTVDYTNKYIYDSSYFYAVVTNSTELPEYDSSTAFMYANNSYNDKKTAVLTGGQMNYVHFVFNPNGNTTNYYYTFGQLKLAANRTISFTNDIITPNQYGFIASSDTYLYKDSSASSNHATAHSVFTVDLTGDTTPKHIEMNQSIAGDFVVVIDNQIQMPTDFSNYVYKVEDNNSHGGIGYFNLIPNQVNYVHLISPYNSERSSDNIYFNSIKIANGYAHDIFKEFNTSSGAWNYSGFEECYTYENALIPYVSGSVAPTDSYMVIDLRNAVYDKMIEINTKFDSYPNQYIYVSDSPEAINYGTILGSNNYEGRKNILELFSTYNGNVYSENNSFSYYYRNYDFVLSKGKKYYLHVGLNPNGSSYPYIRSIISYDVKSYDTKVGLQNISIGTGQGGEKSSYGPDKVDGDYVIGDTNSTDMRFVGSNPNNYIRFNNELWRVVGVFDTEDENGVVKPRIKIVKINGIGSLSYDSSESTINDGYGINEWSQSDIMKLMNPGYSSNTENVTIKNEHYSHTANIDDTGANSGNYSNNLQTKDVVTIPGASTLHVKLTYATEQNYDMVYIFQGTYTGSVSRNMSAGQLYTYQGGSYTKSTVEFDVTGDTVTFAFYSDSSTTYYGYYAVVTDASATSGGSQELTNNSLYWDNSSGYCIIDRNNTVAPCDYTNGLSTDAKSYIDTVVWHTAAVPIGLGGMAPAQIYAAERGSTTGKTNYSARGEGIDDEVTRQSTWTGKVGLLYPSDYIYAAGDYKSGSTIYTPRSSCMSSYSSYGTCMNYADWLSYGSNSRLITPTYNSSLDYTVVGIQASFSYMPSSVSTMIKPTLYLSTKTIVTGGDGSFIAPYTISLGSSDNELMNDYYGLINETTDDPTEPTGTIIDTITDDYEDMKNQPLYGFEYDSSTDYYISNNESGGPSTASSYVVIDRTAELDSTTISLKYDYSSYAGQGVIVIMENQFDDNITIDNYSTFAPYYTFFNLSNKTEETKFLELEGGKKYYIYMAFKKYTSDTPNDTYRENMRVKIEGLEDTTPSTIVTKYSGQRFVEVPETIQILKNISMPTGVTISNMKTIELDLNGYSLTTSDSTPVITNNGILRITDTKTNGVINATTNNGIQNNAGATLEIEDGSIMIDNSSYSAVNNLGNVTIGSQGSINVTNGTGITNTNAGRILNGQGTITGGTCITNNGTSNLEFGGYTLNSCTVNHYSSANLTINNISGTANINDSSLQSYNQITNNLTINNSTFNSIFTGSINGSTTIYGCTVDTISRGSAGSKELTVSASTIGTVTNYGTVNIDSSNITNAATGSSDNPLGTTTYDGCLISSLTNYGTTTVKGASEVTSTITNYKILNIGENDGTVSTTDPYIHGTVSAINNTGSNSSLKVNFYDGVLEGNEDQVVNGKLGAIPSGYSIVSNVSGGRESITLAHQYVAAIGSTGYYSIQEAVTAAPANTQTEIDLLVDLVDSSTVTVPSNKNIILDFNGHSITTYAQTWLTNQGTLSVYNSEPSAPDSVSYGKVLFNNSGILNYDNIKTISMYGTTENNFIVNSGTFNMSSGTLKVAYDSSVINNYNRLVNNTGSFNMTGGTLESYLLFNNPANATITIDGGNIIHHNTNNNYTGYDGITNAGTLTINNVNYEGPQMYSYKNYFINNTGTANILGGSYNDYTIMLYNSGTANIKNLNDTVHQLLYNNTGSTALIEDCDIFIGYVAPNSSQIAANIVNKGSITVKDSEIEAYFSVFNNSSASSISIDNSTITSGTGSSRYISEGSVTTLSITNGSVINGLIQFYGTTMTVSDSRLNNDGGNCINFSGTGALSVTNSYIIASDTAIKNTGTGSITIGSLGGDISKTMPEITGGEYGINSTNTSATFYFYDGIITGKKTQAIVGTVTATEPDFDIITIDQGATMERKYLSGQALVQNLTTDETYDTLQQGINEASNGDTLQFVRDYTTVSNSGISTVPSGKTITIDINSHNISQNQSSGPFITNNGTLTILDSGFNTTSSTQTGKITNNTSNPTIENKGTLVSTRIVINGTIHNDTGATTTIYKGTVATLNNDGTVGTLLNDGISYGSSNSQTTITTVNNAGTIVFEEVKNTTLNNSGTATVGSSNEAYMSTMGTITNTGTLTLGQAGTYIPTASSITNNSSGLIEYYKCRNTGALNVNDNSVTNVYTSSATINGRTTLKNSAVLNIYNGSFNDHINGADNTELNIIGGSIGAKEYNSKNAVYSTSTKPIIIGVKDNAIAPTSPNIYNATSGTKRYKTVYSSTGIKFYDGRVQSNTSGTEAITGAILDIEDNSNVVIDGAYETITFDPIITDTTTSIDYYSLNTALSSAPSGDTLQLKKSVVLLSTYQTSSIASGKTLTIDLNSKFLNNLSSNTTIANAGTLYISNGTLSGTNIINNTGTLNVSSGSYSGIITSTNEMNVTGGSLGTVTNSGILTMSAGSISTLTNNGTFTTFTGGTVSSVENTDTMTVSGGTIGSITNTGTFIMNSGNITSGITNETTGRFTVVDGTIKTDDPITNKNYMKLEGGTYSKFLTNRSSSSYIQRTYHIQNSGELIITGGTFTEHKTSGYSYYDILLGIVTTSVDSTTSYSKPTTNISNIDIPYSVGNNKGTMVLNDVISSGDVENTDTITITDSTIRSYSGGNTASISDSTITSTVSITSGTATISNTSIGDTLSITGSYGNTTVNLSTGTTVTANNNAVEVTGAYAVVNISNGVTITSNSNYGIQLRTGGTANIGSKDGTYSSTSPNITGSAYGIYNNNGKINFYDGIINGTIAISGIVTEVETGYVIDINTHDDIQSATLKIPGENERVIIMNNINYTSLQDAINSAGSGTTNAILYTNYVLTDNITVPSGKTIRLYLNGHTIDNNGFTITGNLTQISGLPAGASIVDMVTNTFASNIQLLILLISVVILIVLSIIVIKKKKKNLY